MLWVTFRGLRDSSAILAPLKFLIYIDIDHTAYCVKLSGEYLSRYSNKLESVGLRKCLYYHYLTKKVID